MEKSLPFLQLQPTLNPSTGLIRGPQTALAALTVFCFELALGVELEFAGWMTVFCFAFILAFNTLGGINSLVAVGLASYASKTVLISQVVKAVLWQNPEAHLLRPTLTIQVFAVGMILMLVASTVATTINLNLAKHFAGVTDATHLRRIAIASVTAGAGSFAFVYSENQSGALFGIASYLQSLTHLGLVASTAACIVRTNRKKSLDALVLAAMGVVLLSGIVSTSKQKMLESFIGYLATCWLFGYRMGMKHLVWTVGCLLAAGTILVPFTTILRLSISGTDTVEQVPILMQRLSQLDLATLENARKMGQKYEDENSYRDSYFESPLSLLERFCLIKPADTLIATTDRKGPLGPELYFRGLDVLPNSILGTRPLRAGNFLGHWTGRLNPGDTATSISYSPVAHAFACDGWIGLICFIGGGFLVFSCALRNAFPQIQYNIWAIWVLLQVHHAIAETSSTWFIVFVLRVLPFVYLTRLVFTRLNLKKV